jgi:phosphoribosyl 1,2-cyclic phosphodiesterase
VRVTFWGTRGSLAAPGPETVRYGGNTACVELRAGDGQLAILDAGSGIRRLGETLTDEARVDIFLTHLHLDHIQGLGFFRPLFRPGTEVHLWGPPSTTEDLGARLARYLSPPLFPVRLRDTPASVVLHAAPETPVTIGRLTVSSALIIHPGPTVGYRISDRHRAVAYLPDHEPALGVRHFPEGPAWTSGCALARDADLLIHDAQYSEADYAGRVGWGHSTLEHATRFAVLAGARRLAPFHHDPSAADDELDGRFGSAARRTPIELVPAREGASIGLD